MRGAERVTRAMEIRMYSLAELAALLRRVGFSEVVAYGSLAGEILTLQSPRGVIVGTR